MSGGTMRVVVIGGGLSGLATAHAVIRDANREGRALRLTLLESSARLGGNIYTERSDGFVVEAGPDAFVVTRPQALHLCEELGLGPRLIETMPQNRRVYVLRRGKLTPMPEGLALGIPSRIRPFLRTPLLSLSGKLRALREVGQAARAARGASSPPITSSSRSLRVSRRMCSLPATSSSRANSAPSRTCPPRPSPSPTIGPKSRLVQGIQVLDQPPIARTRRQRGQEEPRHQARDDGQPGTFTVYGRGELGLAILVETMRREGYDLVLSTPRSSPRRSTAS